MEKTRCGVTLVAAAMALLWAGTALAAPTDAEKCEAYKLKHSGKYALCRMKAESKAVKRGEAPDYTKCDQKLPGKFTKAESKWGSECPTESDADGIKSQVTADSDWLALKLAGERFVDNLDGTVTDTQTGLMWEKKTDGGIHDKDNNYTWSTGTDDPDGTAFTTFLAGLNDCESSDGSAITGGFAGYCDWRLPDIAELQTILLEPDPCGTSPCIDAVFGPTAASFYWSSTTAWPSVYAWFVHFDYGGVGSTDKSYHDYYVRAVRGGS